MMKDFPGVVQKGPITLYPYHGEKLWEIGMLADDCSTGCTPKINNGELRKGFEELNRINNLSRGQAELCLERI